MTRAASKVKKPSIEGRIATLESESKRHDAIIVTIEKEVKRIAGVIAGWTVPLTTTTIKIEDWLEALKRRMAPWYPSAPTVVMYGVQTVGTRITRTSNPDITWYTQNTGDLT